MIPFIRSGEAVSGAPGFHGVSSPPTDALRLSVVIPTYRRPDLLARCLEAVCAQSLAPSAYEVIVVDDGHDDATQALVERSVGLAVQP